MLLIFINSQKIITTLSRRLKKPGSMLPVNHFGCLVEHVAAEIKTKLKGQ